MRTYSGQAVHLSDYQPPQFEISDFYLDIRLDPEETVIMSTMNIARVGGGTGPLVLEGDELKLDFVSINGVDLTPKQYHATPEELTITHLPDKPFELQITTRVNPTTNTKLMGLYRTSGIYCTQCEAEGFRRITYFLDRPDVLTRYTTRIEARRRDTTVLLSNGNLIDAAVIEGTDRHYAIWQDPHPKPSYLFALVGGKLDHIADTFTTKSGREVRLEIYVEPGKTHLCGFAMEALKKSMKWDEEVFGREYDLDVFMIVAVSDFNMGAMENKGLNIFNDKYVLADVDCATDQDFANIEAIIAHEYFHNWTGNRITCRDWFQLCLKEGFTVFRDQEFTSDTRSRAVKRISDVRTLRARQFPEDGGPLAHPVRPSVYHEINNFYTATVYEKGAELVRMIKTITGDEGFAKGVDLYFDRHDGEAATMEDFIAAIEDGASVDLSHFKLWYEQAGTPQVIANGTYDENAKTFTLDLVQATLPTPGQAIKKPLHIPVRFGLVGKDGKDLGFDQVEGGTVSGDVIHLREASERLTFSGVKERPVPSLMRAFSAPVRLDIALSENDFTHLVAHDKDPFNRWQAMQTIAVRMLKDKMDSMANERAPNDTYDSFFEGVECTIADETLDPAFRAFFLSFPSETDLAQEAADNVDPTLIHMATQWLSRELATRAQATLLNLYQAHATREAYCPDGEQVGQRTLKNAALRLLAIGGPDGHDIAREQFHTAHNLTDEIAALTALVWNNAETSTEALVSFDRKNRTKPLVMDKWFSIQAMSPSDGTLVRVKELMKHPVFSITNPNRIRALIGAFSAGNHVQFHKADGSGYQFLSSLVVDLDQTNPQVAARLLTSFGSWTKLEPRRRDRAERALRRVANSAGLSPDLRDIVNRTLGKT